MDKSKEAKILLAPERRSKILELVRRNKSVLVKDLCNSFGVTGETIRKDLAFLEQEGLLIKAYGGAYVKDGVKNEIDASIRETLFTEAKEAIGRACAELVENGDTIFLDESTTCLAIARHLLNFDGITVVTNSLKISTLYAEKGRGKLLLSGGELDRKNQCFVGGSAEEFLSRYFVDKSFISCRGMDRAAGVTDGSSINGRIRALMLRQGSQRFLVLDCTKIGQVNFFRICDFSSIDTIIADTLPSQEWRDFLKEKKIKVIEIFPE
jgi:DeoR/GlpR family transcriptional regulator of sugar metabolism